MGNQKWAILLVIIFALAIRIGWVAHLPTDNKSLWALPDQVEYYEIAQNVLRGKGFHFWDKRFFSEIIPNSTIGDVHAFRMPGYPLIVAACGGKIAIVRVVQAILDASTVLAAYLLARRWMSERPALLAAILVAVNPFLIYFSGLMLSETVFVAMLAWGMVLLTRETSPSPGTPGEGWGEGSVLFDSQTGGQKNPHPARDTGVLPRVRGRGGLIHASLGVVLLALSIHIRPSAMLLPILLPLVIRRDWKLPIIGALAVVLVLLPWAIRNKRLLGEWVWTTTNSGFTLYDGFNPKATGASDQSFIKDMPQLKEMNEVDRSRYLSARAQSYIATNLPRVASLTFNKIARTWSPIPLSEQFGSRKLYRLVGGAYSVVLFGLVVVALFRCNLPKNVLLFLLMPAVYFTVIHAMSVGSLRYRLPAEVPLAVLAASVIGIADRRLSTVD